MHLSDYTYTLPEDLITDTPPKIRGSSRLMVLSKSTKDIHHKSYADIYDYLEPGDVIVLNDTKVIKARLIAQTAEGKERELLLLENHSNQSPFVRRCMYRGKLTTGDILRIHNHTVTVDAIMGDGIAQISSSSNLVELADAYGNVPLPPYMKREATLQDNERYQTVFAVKPGSVAAPTASLNFTNELKDKLIQKGVVITYLTLHVGLGTFLPIRSDAIEDHTMHSEYFEIPKTTVEHIKKAKSEGRKIMAVGTTVTRTLEYAAADLLETETKDISGEADIFIYPGYSFKIVDQLLTNFHAPRSTVLMLTAAFSGWSYLKDAYNQAVAENYRFLSYGDSMLIRP